LKQKLIDTADMLDNREHMLMLKSDEIMDMKRLLNEANEREMKNLNMYEQQRIVTDQV
jgi:predicted GNAT family N-acyltransferase